MATDRLRFGGSRAAIAATLVTAAAGLAVACGSEGGGNNRQIEPTVPSNNPDSNTELIALAEDIGVVSDMEGLEYIPESKKAQIGKIAPNLTLESLGGKHFELKDILGKKPIMLFSMGYITPDPAERVGGQMEIKRVFGDQIEVVALTHFSEAESEPVEFPIYLANKDFVEKYTNSATKFYLIDRQGKIVYMAHLIFAEEPYALIKSFLQYSESPVITDGSFSLPFSKNPDFARSSKFADLRHDLLSLINTDDFTEEEFKYLVELLERAEPSSKDDLNFEFSPIDLANFGRIILEKYCVTRSEDLGTLLRNAATVTYDVYLEAVDAGVVHKSLWDLLRYNFDPECQDLVSARSQYSTELEDGSLNFGNGVIGPSRKDRDSVNAIRS